MGVKWLWVFLGLVYLLSPYDLIPGLHGIGWIDDIFVLIFLYRYLTKKNNPRTDSATPLDEQQQGTSEGKAPSEPPPKTPHAILEISSSASRDEIKAAYRRLAGQYHPDKVAHLGDEFQTLAEQRFKEIKDAYEKLVRP